jgi:hypothetical protein
LFDFAVFANGQLQQIRRVKKILPCAGRFSLFFWKELASVLVLLLWLVLRQDGYRSAITGVMSTVCTGNYVPDPFKQERVDPIIEGGKLPERWRLEHVLGLFLV